MIDIYEEKGLTKEEAETVVDIFSRYPDQLVDIMLVEELGLMPPDESAAPWKNGVIMFFSFLIFGSVPLLAYIIALLAGASKENSKAGFDITFIIACFVTALTLFALGAFKSRFSSQRWWVSALFTLGYGAVAAGASYLIGYLLQLIVGGNSC